MTAAHIWQGTIDYLARSGYPQPPLHLINTAQAEIFFRHESYCLLLPLGGATSTKVEGQLILQYLYGGFTDNGPLH